MVNKTRATNFRLQKCFLSALRGFCQGPEVKMYFHVSEIPYSLYQFFQIRNQEPCDSPMSAFTCSTYRCQVSSFSAVACLRMLLTCRKLLVFITLSLECPEPQKGYQAWFPGGLVDICSTCETQSLFLNSGIVMPNSVKFVVWSQLQIYL